MALVKICGLKDPSALDAALNGGARYVGFMHFAKSPRHIPLAQAAGLAVRARGRADVVAVTVDASDDTLAAIASQLRPDWIQLHGSETPARAAEVRRFAGKGVWKVLGVAAVADVEAAGAYENAADMLMFETEPPPGSDRPGGNGLAFDWAIMKGRAPKKPWLLAGGLRPENVAEAIQLSDAPAVDVSSGVESAPGVKDPARIKAFLAAAGARPSRP